MLSKADASALAYVPYLFLSNDAPSANITQITYTARGVMQGNRRRLGQGGIDAAAARIRRLLEREEQDQQSEQAMVDRLRASGWQPNLPPAPAGGPRLADAAQAIEARLNREDAYRAEARRRLVAEATRSGEVRRKADGSGITPLADDSGASGDWEERGREIAGWMDFDPDLVVAAGPDIVPALGSLYGYRHLDRQGQHEVMRQLERWQDTDPQLYGRMRAKIADIVAQPHWEPWSMSDEELDKAIDLNEEFLKWYNRVTGATNAASVGLGTRIPPLRTGGLIGLAGLAASEMIRGGIESGTARMLQEQEDREDGKRKWREENAN